MAELAIISPHGHTDPAWFAGNAGFPDPAQLFVTPDHYVFRMLFSQGVPLESLGIAPRDGRYLHEETWHDDNGHSHVRASVVGPSLALPIVEGRVPLGTWQQVVLIDSDTRPRARTVHLSVMGV